MKVLTTSEEVQTLTIIPRSYASTVSVVLRDETTNEVTTYTNISTTQNKGYLSLSNAFSLVENTFYELTVKEGSNVIYKDKIFCTDQTVASYSVNDGVYTTENTYDNEYIIL
jgi:hypothetical protein